jgi:hypothetical protein
MNITEVGPKLKEVIAIESADLFESRWPNLLVCFSTGDVFSAIASYLRIEGLPQSVKDDFSCPTLCKATEGAFLTLLKRGALDEFVRVNPLPPAAQAELDAMSGVINTIVDPAVEARASQIEALDEVVSDFRGGLNSRDFRNKWMAGEPTRRTVYEAAIASGRI